MKNPTGWIPADQPISPIRSMLPLLALFSSCSYISKVKPRHCSISAIPNICSHVTAAPKYIPREQIGTTESRLQNANLTSLDRIIDIPKQSKALVVAARSRETVQWIEDVEPDWIKYPYILSENDNPNSTLSVPANNGNEAMRYLTFIIDNYDSLPDFIAFRHGHGSAWHQRFDSAIEINNLNLTTVRLRGYQNFNCVGVWGCDEHINLAEKQRTENASSSQTKRLLSARSAPEVDAAIYENWDTWFGVPMPEDVTGPCCAQFAVTKEAVYGRTKEKYVEWRQWLVASPLTAFHSGMVFERLWHVIFGMPAVLCQEDEQCWCSTFVDPLTDTCPT